MQRKATFVVRRMSEAIFDLHPASNQQRQADRMARSEFLGTFGQ
jgi:hypothetical protein